MSLQFFKSCVLVWTTSTGNKTKTQRPVSEFLLALNPIFFSTPPPHVI